MWGETENEDKEEYLKWTRRNVEGNIQQRKLMSSEDILKSILGK